MDAGELAARARTRGDAAPWLEQRWRWGRRPPVPAARQEKQGECRAMAGLAPCALPAARGGRSQGEKKWRLGKNRGVGMENFQVSTPIYRSSPRVRVSYGPIGLGWIWPKHSNGSH
jgi:hypothetical protein